MTDAHALDDSVYEAVARTSTPALDGPFTWISNAANYGQLWAAIAAVLALTGGPRGRRAAPARALLALGVTSITANLALKQALPGGAPNAPPSIQPGRRDAGIELLPLGTRRRRSPLPPR